MMANRMRNSEIAGGQCNSVPAKRRDGPYYFWRCKGEKSSTNIESLPYELLFNILLHLSAEDVYNGAMLVCRKWYDMIRTHDFIQAHLHHSTPGLLVKRYGMQNNYSSFVAIRHGQIEVSKFSYTIRAEDWWDSSNGLLLEYRLSAGPRRFHVINPATKQIFEIPQFSWQGIIHCWWTVAFSAASNEYKVVRTYYNLANPSNLCCECDIVTIGVDKSWRRVCIDHLSPASMATLCWDTTVTEGYIHCTHICHHNHVLTLNVETEIITENPIPQDSEKRTRRYLSAGKSLSMFCACDELSFEVWEMKSETGEWTKMYNIDLEPHKCKLENLYGKMDAGFIYFKPVGWLKYQEVVVLRFLHPARFHIAYNVRTHEIDWFELDSGTYAQDFKVHTSSLVGLV